MIEVSDLTSRCNSKLSDLDHGTDTITVENKMCFASFEVCERASRGMELWFCLREAYSIRWQFDGCLFLLWQVVQRSCLWSMFCDIYAGSCYPVHSLPGWAGSEFVTGAEQRKFRWPRYICLSMFCIFFWRWNPINHLCLQQLQQGRHRVSMRIIRTRKVGWHHARYTHGSQVEPPLDCEWVVSELVSCWRWKRMQPAICPPHRDWHAMHPTSSWCGTWEATLKDAKVWLWEMPDPADKMCLVLSEGDAWQKVRYAYYA